MFEIKETHELIRLVERMKPPASFLLERMFPNAEQILQETLPVEYYKGGRRLAPFVIKGSKGANVAREVTTIKTYRCPVIGARRVIGLDDISQRYIGETPIFTTMSAEERAAAMQAQDLVDLRGMLTNKKTAMAAELLQTGKIPVTAYADDGRIVSEETIKFEGWQSANKNWTTASAKIFDDLEAASELIQQESGLIPTLLICGKNILKYMRENTQMKEFVLNANANALSWLNFKPQYVSPQVRFIGYIPALNLEMVSYAETYTDGGEIKPFIGEDMAILCVPGRGKQIYGALTYLDQSGSWNSAAAAEVPVYNYNVGSQTTSLTVYSRMLPIPEDISDFVAIKAKP